jgi:putative MFS transporter
MTELSPASLRSIRWTVTLAASLGWFFDAYVITIYALTVPLLAAEFHLATNILSGAIGSIFLFGYTIGTIGFGVSGDRFGRRVMLGVSVVGYGVVTALTALASGIGSLAAFRFLTVRRRGELSIGSPYVTEVWAATNADRHRHHVRVLPGGYLLHPIQAGDADLGLAGGLSLAGAGADHPGQASA